MGSGTPAVVIACLAWCLAHPIHTTMTTVTYDRATEQLTATTRAFASDIDQAIARRPHKDVAEYAQSAIAFTDQTGRLVPTTWCGSRRGGDVVWLCLRAAAPHGSSGMRIADTMLFEVFADQVNIVMTDRTSLLFTKGDRPKFFATPIAFRDWLERHHERATEVLVGFYKKDSGKPSLTWPESVDEALCFGWIDGVRRNIDAVSYSIRFTPRTSRSNWSAINVKRMSALIAEGRVQPRGLAAFEQRSAERTGIYAYENRKKAVLDPEFEKLFKCNKKAWAYFQSEAPSYRQVAIWWIVTAKKDETRRSRLATLITDSALGRRIASQRPRR